MHVNGDNLATPMEYKLFGSEVVTTQVAIYRSEGSRLKFDPIVLFLRSSCLKGTDDEAPPKISKTTIWTHQEGEDKSIVFTPPCPPIQFATRQTKHVYNQQRLENNLIEVSIINNSSGKLFDRSKHNEGSTGERKLNQVVLLYRRFGDWNVDASSWTVGNLVDQSNDPADFSNEGVEDSFGNATLFWDVSAMEEDSRYEVKIQSQCDAPPFQQDGHPTARALQLSDTQVVEFILDRAPPLLYGTPKVQLIGSVELILAEEYVIWFSERLYCEAPYVFDIAIDLISGAEGSASLSIGDGLDVTCSEQAIRYRFQKEERLQNYVFGPNTQVKIVLDGVQDYAGNRAGVIEIEPHFWSPGKRVVSAESDGNNSKEVPVPTCTPSQTSQLSGQGCDGIDNNCNELVDECAEDEIPPRITFKGGLAVDAIDDGDVTFISNPAFRTIEDAAAYLRSIVEAEDDCASGLQLEVIPPITGVQCESTEFEVVASDPRCSVSVARTFMMVVDPYNPIVDISFDNSTVQSDEHYGVGNTDYLHIVSLPQVSLNRSPAQFFQLTHTMKQLA